MKQINGIFKMQALVFAAFLSIGLLSCSKSDDAAGSDNGGGNGENFEREFEAPSINILNPTAEGAFVTADKSIVISGTAQDNSELASVTYTVNKGASATAEGLEDWNISNLQLPEGDNVVEVTAMDKSENKSSASIVITKNKYLTFLGMPHVDNDVIFTNQSESVWITANIASNDNLIPTSVRLIEVDENNKEIAEICALQDNGDLNDGDEIKGDNVYSAKYNFGSIAEGTKKFRVSAKTKEAEGEVEGFSAVFQITILNQQNAEQKVEGMLNTQGAIEKNISDLLNSSTASEQQEKEIISTLEKMPEIASVQSEGSVIKVTHKSGLESYVMMETEGYRGAAKEDGNKRYSTPTVPLSKQTRGIKANLGTYKAPFFTRSTNGVSPSQIIQNKKVLIWAPFENKGIKAMDPSLFEKSPVNFVINTVTNEDCTIESLQKITDYGIVVLDTHGAGGKLLFTSEKADLKNVLLDLKDYISGVKCLVTMKGGTYLAVTHKYIRNKLEGSFPNSIIFNSSCESMKTDFLANAFISKGAKTYVGFNGALSNTIGSEKEKEFFSALVGNDLKTTGQSYVFDPKAASYVMSGSKDMRFYLGLINGDFEYGNLNGWNVDGDGRVITQLGFIKPTQGYYMGIVSTGLGYTTDYGSISQSFKVTNEGTLSITWNFLSEEFMEYVGSKYQDYLKVTIIDGQEEQVIYSMAIDDYAKDYELTPVSPEIVFDKFDVYMTGWKVSTFDISSYKGKTITLKIACGDVGDSIYDSVALLDEITVY